MASPWPVHAPSAADRAAFADAVVRPFWLDEVSAREAHPPLVGAVEAELCIVGGGFTGLWAAVQARCEDSSRSVVLIEADRCGTGASGRNGGFVSSSLTHGLANGLARFEAEMPMLERLGLENLDGLGDDLLRHGIEAEYEATGDLVVALEPHELEALKDEAALLRRFGHRADLLDRDAVRAQIDSPTYLGALWLRSGSALVHPGKLVEGLRETAVKLGVQIFESTSARAVRRDGAGASVMTDGGVIRAARVLLATSAYPPLLRSVRRYIAPVYDYVLVTEPLTPDQHAAVRWRERQGVSDSANRFHYYRLTRDDRILWGGYDAVYRFRGQVAPHLDDHEPTFAGLSQHFFTTFPQLRGIRFTHRWGGAIDTCSRFSVFFGTALNGRVAYATGYTGLGVAASRFGARVALDLLDNRASEATRLEYVRRRPVPFPPEPLRFAVIQLTRNRLVAADRHQGRRGIWLRTLDRLGLGFDS